MGGEFQDPDLDQSAIGVPGHQLGLGGVGPHQQAAGSAAQRPPQGFGFKARAGQPGQPTQRLRRGATIAEVGIETAQGLGCGFFPSAAEVRVGEGQKRSLPFRSCANMMWHYFSCSTDAVGTGSHSKRRW